MCIPPKPRVLVAEDHASISDALVRLLAHDFQVVGVVTSGEALIIRTNELLPDAIVTDISLVGLSGLLATASIPKFHPTLPIVVITANPDPTLHSAAIAKGASAFLPKQEAGRALVDLLHELVY